MNQKQGVGIMKSKYILIKGIIAIFAAAALHAHDQKMDQPWTWVYKKAFHAEAQKLNAAKKELLFSKGDIKPFSQLIFSWNAVRPAQGHFSFLVQARDARTKQWGKWHHMIDWGARIQKSYLSSSDGCTQYVHVRLETEQNKRTDAFRIKVDARNGADLSLLRSLTVSLADYEKFKPESLDGIYLSSVSIAAVPKISQFALDHPESKRLCSPTSCSILTGFLRGEYVDPIDFADGVFDHGLEIFGSWPFNVAHAYEHCREHMHFCTRRLNSFTELYHQLQRGIPVVVSVRGSLEGAPKVYDNGHLLVVVGWDAKKRTVICHDPALHSHKKTLKHYPVNSFVHAWERSRRLVYWAEPVRV